MSEPVRWLSQVCDVMTDPSAEASLPTVMQVQASSGAAGASQKKNVKTEARTIVNKRTGNPRLFYVRT